jgi:hypothetical protein
MTYDALGPGPLDYLPCRYGTSKLLFRGPKRDLSEPYVAFIGTTETYGKFIDAPFPNLVEEELGISCVNFGQCTAGVDAFAADSFVIKASSDAEITVIQIMGAQNMTNRFYSVHPRRNDRFLSAASILQTIYREVDFAEFNFNRHMLSHLMALSPVRFATVRQELQDAWLARMQFLLSQIKGKTILLWMSAQAPCRWDEDCTGDLGGEPLFITREMVDKIIPNATAYVEVVASSRARAEGVDGMVFSEMDGPAAAEMLGPIAHREVAEALVIAIEQIS